jgi:hypothetical protein
MKIAVLVVALFVIAGILWDAFETIVLPRRVSRRLRFVRLVFVPTWKVYSGVLRQRAAGGKRENYLGYFGPLSVIGLLVTWAAGLILGFALLLWGLGTPLASEDGPATFGTDLYMSGTTFFTLGLGDVRPRSAGARVVAVVESGIGFGFLALVISYLPVLYQAFSRREVRIAMLDAWAGSPPTAVELLRRLGTYEHLPALGPLLEEWEHWAAELLETHISYPVLCYFRSQHDNQSWLAALTTILDACALTMVGLDGVPSRGAMLTFAMARHAVVDLSQVLGRPPRAPETDRLPPPDLLRVRAMLVASGMVLREGQEADARLAELRRTYEPYANALASYLLMPLPAWIPVPGVKDNWQKSAWK